MMTYLFLGNNVSVKSEKINAIKSKYLTSNEALHFDFELLYADKLDKDDLKKALLNLPAVAKKRIVLIKSVEKLKAEHTKILASFLTDERTSTVLILDSDSVQIKSKFVTEVKRLAKVSVCDDRQVRTVFDMTNAMAKRQHVAALKTLSQILEDGEPPLRIIGALVWFWGRMRNKLSQPKFQKGLVFLQEADLNIKRSRLKPEYAVEKCVISLSALLI